MLQWETQAKHLQIVLFCLWYCNLHAIMNIWSNCNFHFACKLFPLLPLPSSLNQGISRSYLKTNKRDHYQLLTLIIFHLIKRCTKQYFSVFFFYLRWTRCKVGDDGKPLRGSNLTTYPSWIWIYVQIWLLSCRSLVSTHGVSIAQII